MNLGFLADAIGIVGVSLILLCYFLLQIEKMCQAAFAYSLLNLIGAIFILLSLMVHWNLASVIIEIFWVLISIYGLLKWRKQRQAS